jgi:hypothetical protein
MTTHESRFGERFSRSLDAASSCDVRSERPSLHDRRRGLHRPHLEYGRSFPRTRERGDQPPRSRPASSRQLLVDVGDGRAGSLQGSRRTAYRRRPDALQPLQLGNGGRRGRDEDRLPRDEALGNHRLPQQPPREVSSDAEHHGSRRRSPADRLLPSAALPPGSLRARDRRQARGRARFPAAGVLETERGATFVHDYLLEHKVLVLRRGTTVGLWPPATITDEHLAKVVCLTSEALAAALEGAAP